MSKCIFITVAPRCRELLSVFPYFWLIKLTCKYTNISCHNKDCRGFQVGSFSALPCSYCCRYGILILETPWSKSP